MLFHIVVGRAAVQSRYGNLRVYSHGFSVGERSVFRLPYLMKQEPEIDVRHGVFRIQGNHGLIVLNRPAHLSQLPVGNPNF